MEFEAEVTKTSGFYDVDPIRGLSRKQLDEIVKSDASFLKKVKMTFTDTKALKVGELRSLMAFGDSSKALPKLAGSKGKAAPKKGKASPKKTKMAKMTVSELRSAYKEKFGKASTGMKKEEIISALEGEVTKGKKSPPGSPKSKGKKSPPKSKGKKSPPKAKGKKSAKSPLALAYSEMTVSQLKKAYQTTFDQEVPAKTLKAAIIKALNNGKAIGKSPEKKPAKTSKGKTSPTKKVTKTSKGKKSPEKKPKVSKGKKSPEKKSAKTSKGKKSPEKKAPKTSKGKKEIDYSKMKLAELKMAYQEKFGEEPGARLKTQLVRALNAGKALSPLKPKVSKGTKGATSVARPSSTARCTDPSDFKKCGDDEHCGVDGECLPGKGVGPYLRLPNRSNIYGDTNVLKEWQKTLGGEIVDGDERPKKATTPKKSSTPKKPKTPTKLEIPKGEEVKLSLSKRTEILAAIKDKIQECMAAESKAALV